MTAPTTRATPKIALDQRAASRHDKAARRDIPRPLWRGRAGDCRLGIVISDCRSLVLERDQHLADAGDRGETPLHNMRAGRAGHIFDRKRHLSISAEI
jgi:hypothetical protein